MTDSAIHESSAETHSFQAEIKQLLDIVIHSLYTHKEIFVRELISNAADALEKFRHETLVNSDLSGKDDALEIRVDLDEEAKTFVITDNGIGMTRDELSENLGTIARSGTKAFLQKLQEGGQNDLSLIGQFGVGFYSSFMVAKKVTVETRSYHSDSQGWRWESDGEGAYSITSAEGIARGTRITIELKDDDAEYAKDYRVRDIITRFSNFVNFPILLGDEKVNTVQAIWARSKNEVKDEEYTEFYKFIAAAPDEPHTRLHFSADAPLAINALIFAPKENVERYGFGRTKPGVDLYCRKVLIMKQPEELLPEWMRFAKGVIDSEDLPLNISRETLQDNRLVQKLSNVVTGRFIKHLAEEAEKEPEKFKEFHESHGQYIKEGVIQDFRHRDDLAKLLRFETSKTEKGEAVPLNKYVERMKEGQTDIYFINGPSRAAIEAGPYVEAFRARDIEVIYAFEQIDDFVLTNLAQFDEKKIVSADSGDLTLPGDEPKGEGEELSADAAGELCGWLKTALGERVQEVKVSKRLVGSPAVATTEGGMTSTMQRVLSAMNRDGSDVSAALLKLEINPRNPLIHKLNDLRGADEDFAKTVAEQLLDNALIAAGLLTDPRNMVERMNQLLAKAAGA